MPRRRGTMLACLAAAALAATGSALARDGGTTAANGGGANIPVTHMPPVMRAAYLEGIRDELIAHGYNPGPASDPPSRRFRTAISRYQQDAGLRPDGVASKVLLDHLMFALPKVHAGGVRRVPDRTGRHEIAPMALAPPAVRPDRPSDAPVPVPAPRGKVSAAPLPDTGRSRGTARPRPKPQRDANAASRQAGHGQGGFVSQTQRILRSRGYYDGPIDGRFGDALADAIRAFQKANRLPVTGVIDGPLLEALS